MKIAFVVQRYGKNINGGAEQHCRQLARKLSMRHEVEILTTTAEDYQTWENSMAEGSEVIEGITVRRFNCICQRNGFFADLSSFGQRFGYFDDLNWMLNQGPVSDSLINFISYHKDDYDIFVFFTYLYYTTYAGLGAVPEKSILIPTAHDEPPIYRNIFKSVFNLPGGIFFNTPEEADFVHGLFGNKHIPYRIGGIGFDDVLIGNADVFRKKYGITDPFILYAGRITDKKGCGELFDFYEKSGTNLELVLVGKKEMEVPVSNNIYLLGFVSDEDKSDAMAASEALIVPSEFESFSMVLAEEMMHKKPVVVNGKCNVLKGHCRRSNGGIYYENSEEFKECLKFIENKSEAERLGKNGYRYISENYSWDKIVSEFELLAKQVINREGFYNEV